MTFPAAPRSAGAAAGRHAFDAGLGPGQAAALRRCVLRQGHPRRDDADVRQGHRGRLQGRAVPELDAVQAGHRTRGAAARQPRNRQHRAAGLLQADAGLVDPDLGLPVPRRQPPERLLRQRPGRADEEDGRGPGEGEDPGADLLRHAPGGPEAEEEDQHAGRPGRHQAAHAAGRRLAAAWAARWAPTRRRWPMPRPTPACRPAPSTARTTRCRTCRT